MIHGALVAFMAQQFQNCNLPASLRWVLKSDMMMKGAANIANNTADKDILKIKVMAACRKFP
jgi:hypothetical protein